MLLPYWSEAQERAEFTCVQETTEAKWRCGVGGGPKPRVRLHREQVQCVLGGIQFFAYDFQSLDGWYAAQEFEDMSVLRTETNDQKVGTPFKESSGEVHVFVRADELIFTLERNG